MTPSTFSRAQGPRVCLHWGRVYSRPLLIFNPALGGFLPLRRRSPSCILCSAPDQIDGSHTLPQGQPGGPREPLSRDTWGQMAVLCALRPSRLSLRREVTEPFRESHGEPTCSRQFQVSSGGSRGLGKAFKQGRAPGACSGQHAAWTVHVGPAQHTGRQVRSLGLGLR